MTDEPSFLATGNINPSRFVSLSGNMQVQQAGANDAALIGISDPGTDFAPGVGAGSTLAAKAGEGLRVYGIGKVTLLTVTAAVTYGQRLKPDANGQGVVVGTGSVQNVGAIALESANAGELCRVYVILMATS
jgi:hypothetical protein